MFSCSYSSLQRRFLRKNDKSKAFVTRAVFLERQRDFFYVSKLREVFPQQNFCLERVRQVTNKGCAANILPEFGASTGCTFILMENKQMSIPQ